MTEVFSPGPKKPLNPPYGGKLVDLIVPAARMEAVRINLLQFSCTRAVICNLTVGFPPSHGRL
jgi:hypothetical protein